ncbi:MAG: hypothetical protein AAFO94_00660 [Bacteroidota bacterium]
MANYQCHIDGPDRYFDPNDIYRQGNSPAALAAVQTLLQQRREQLSEVFVCLRRFNNEALHGSLLGLSQQGIAVRLICQPIDALSENPMSEMKDLMTGLRVEEGESSLISQSAYALARPIFAAHYKTTYPNFQLHFFPHLNIRSAAGNPFNKSAKPYSLENDVILLLYKSGGGAVVYLTADCSVGEPVAESVCMVVEDDWSLLKTTHRFFQILLRNAVPLKHFDFKRKYNDLILRPEAIAQDESGFYTAPFMTESTAFAELAVTKLIRSAQRRIWIYAPEVSAYEYTVDGHYHEDYENEIIEHYGFLRPATEMAAAGVELRCLAKDFDSEAATAFIAMAQYTANVTLRTHAGVGCSFILVDGVLLLSNGAFDPEVFIYLNDVQIEKFDAASDTNFTGIYAKMRQYLRISDAGVVQQFESLFDNKWTGARKVIGV